MSDLQIKRTVLFGEEEVNAVQKLQHLRSALAKLESNHRHSENLRSLNRALNRALPHSRSIVMTRSALSASEVGRFICVASHVIYAVREPCKSVETKFRSSRACEYAA